MIKTDLDRWIKPTSYRKDWFVRSDAMLQFIDDTLPQSLTFSYTEYGCGPNAPFTASLAKSNRSCLRYDIKKWGGGCQVVNLNDPDFSVETSDVAVMGGVAEYIDDLESMAVNMAKFHKYLLLSYHPFNEPKLLRKDPMIELNKRTFKHGWHNHHTFDELLKTLSKSAFPVRMMRLKAQVIGVFEFS